MAGKGQKKSAGRLTTAEEKAAARAAMAKEGLVGTDNPPVTIYKPGDNPGIDVADFVKPEECEFQGFSLSTGRMTSLADGLKSYGLEGVGGIIPCYAKIPTPDGFVRAERLEIGDCIFGADGKPTKIMALDHLGWQSYIEFVLKDERTFQVAERSLVVTRRSYGHSTMRQYRRAIDMWETGALKKRGYQFAVALGNPVEYPESELPLHPYLMGILLGDGCRSDGGSLLLSSDDIQIADIMARIVGAEHYCQQQNCFTWRFYTGEVAGWKTNRRYYYGDMMKVKDVAPEYAKLLNHYAYEKWIPEEYLRSSIEQRLLLVCGLLDSEGTIAKAKKGAERFNVSFSSTSLQLAEGVQEIIRSLGGSAHLRIEKTPEKHGVNRNQYAVMILVPPEMKKSLFLLPRKKEIAEEAANYVPKKNYTKSPIIDCRRIELSRPAVRIIVERPDHLFIGENFVVMHDGSFYNVEPGLDADCQYRQVIC